MAKQQTVEEMREERMTSSPPEIWVGGKKVWDRDIDKELPSPQDVIKKILARGPRKAK